MRMVRNYAKWPRMQSSSKGCPAAGSIYYNFGRGMRNKPFQMGIIRIYNFKMKANHHPAGGSNLSTEPQATEPMVANGGPVGRVLRLSSQVLFAGAAEVEIDHHGVLYRLRQTSLGKLILTK